MVASVFGDRFFSRMLDFVAARVGVKTRDAGLLGGMTSLLSGSL